MQALREESGSEASSDIDEIKANIKNEMKSMKSTIASFLKYLA